MHFLFLHSTTAIWIVIFQFLVESWCERSSFLSPLWYEVNFQFHLNRHLLTNSTFLHVSFLATLGQFRGVSWDYGIDHYFPIYIVVAFLLTLLFISQSFLPIFLFSRWLSYYFVLAWPLFTIFISALDGASSFPFSKFPSSPR